MIVGVLTTSYPRSDDDPAGHFVRGFAGWLAAHVGEVEVVALDAPADPAARLRQGGLPGQLRGLGALRGALFGARLAAEARRRARRWDAIVSHWLLPCGLIGDGLARGRRHLAIAHGTDVAWLRRVPGGSAWVRRLSRRAELVYVADALRVPGAPGRVVAMPAAASGAPRSDGERIAARRALGLPPPGEGPLVLLFCGRMVADKGVDLLVEALPGSALALLVGDGPDRPRALPPSARWLGPRFGAALRACFAAADLLVVPSRRDGTPTVLAEARAAGLPILATRVGGMADAIGHGCLVAPDADALRQTIAVLAADRARLPPPGPAPRDWAAVGPALWGSAAAVMGVTTRQQSVIFC